MTGVQTCALPISLDNPGSQKGSMYFQDRKISKAAIILSKIIKDIRFERREMKGIEKRDFEYE